MLQPLHHNWEGFQPVSYTHLDVYKRQVRYNEGFDAAMKIATNITVIEGPDVEIGGKLVIKGPKRIREERGE